MVLQSHVRYFWSRICQTNQFTLSKYYYFWLGIYKKGKILNFKVGDFVEVVDDTINGYVVSIEGSKITFEDKDGFPFVYGASQLVRIRSEIKVSSYEVAKVKGIKDLPLKPKSKVPKKKLRNAPKMEVDLHINQLVKSTKGMNNFDMLNLQVETAKQQLEFAIRKRIQKVVFIHGVGEGVLKEELKYLFNKYNVKHYDAEYSKYGLGATEVYIYQNAN